MSDAMSIRRMLRSRPWWFWAYATTGVLVLLLVMFLLADRAAQPSGRFEPVASTVAPENEFVPADRPISDCISAIPRPGCGSEARGGWRQGLIFLVIVTGLCVITWRVVSGARRARREPGETAPDEGVERQG